MAGSDELTNYVYRQVRARMLAESDACIVLRLRVGRRAHNEWRRTHDAGTR
ncbi:hypothetical protein [Streptomyces sp. NBC_00996]|uniref:hypothetical protein n=1 Tax=Streptomyces sp. NBC_00996 TaxID=2903710 RepID=UPI00386F7499|nr:hypothetical protein OG390_15450 [Streptomyces sp. NBC_00996]